MELNFEFTIDEVVYVKPDDLMSKYDTPKFISYKVVSRIYEELNQEGNGTKSYVVRHIDAATPGGGKLYKFSESELMSRDAYKALMEISRSGNQSNPIDNTLYGKDGKAVRAYSSQPTVTWTAIDSTT